MKSLVTSLFCSTLLLYACTDEQMAQAVKLANTACKVDAMVQPIVVPLVSTVATVAVPGYGAAITAGVAADATVHAAVEVACK